MVEAHVASYGVIGALAVVALAAGAGILVDAAGGGVALGLAVGLAAGGVAAVYLAFVLGRMLAVRRTPVRGGRAGLIGHRGRSGSRRGRSGAYWSTASSGGRAPGKGRSCGRATRWSWSMSRA